MANTLEPEDINWEFATSWAFSDFHAIKYLNTEYGLEKEVITNKKDLVSFGKPKTYYYIKGSEKPYTNIEELCKDWNEIKNFDDPNNEIVWVKVIKTK